MNVEKFLSLSYAVDAGHRYLRDVDGVDTKPIIYTDIVHYCRGIEIDAADRVREALASNIGVRRQYQRLLEREHIFHAPRIAAAATEEKLAERTTESFSLKLVKARDRNQYYMVLEILHADTVADGTELVLHVVSPDGTGRCMFPPLHQGRSQVVISDDDRLLELVSNIDTEIYIR